MAGAPATDAQHATKPKGKRVRSSRSRWLVFQFAPVSLFALKPSRATSTAGKTLLIPTPYAVKMGILDVSLRHALTDSPGDLVRTLSKADLRIGVPEHACVTGTIQRIRQQTRDEDRKKDPDLPPYRANIAMRECLHHQGTLRVAFDERSCTSELVALLMAAAPAINYFGKRGGFFQYLGASRQDSLDLTFTQPVSDPGHGEFRGHRAILDDFGPSATFAALNSFSATKIERGVDRVFVETLVPLAPFNSGPGFIHFRVSRELQSRPAAP